MKPVFVFCLIISISLQSPVISTNFEKAPTTSFEISKSSTIKNTTVTSPTDNAKEPNDLDLLCHHKRMVIEKQPLIEPLIAAGLLSNIRLPVKLIEKADGDHKKEIHLICMRVETSEEEEYLCRKKLVNSSEDSSEVAEDMNWDYEYH